MIKTLFSASKRNVTFANHKDKYYKDYWFPKNLCNGIKDVADLEQSSLQVAAVKLMKAGFSSYMGEKLAQQIELDRIARAISSVVWVMQ